MGRIEYEYPLFKVYYSNNSNYSNIRGNPGPGTVKFLFGLLRALIDTLRSANKSVDNSLASIEPNQRQTAAARARTV